MPQQTMNGSTERVGALLYEGGTLLNANKGAEARVAFQQALQLEPKNAHAHHGMGFTYLLEGKLQEAILCFEHSLTHNAALLEVYHNLATAWRNAGRPLEAIKVLRRALKYHPHSAPTFIALGHTLFQSSFWDEATDAFKKAIRLAPENAEAHYNLAVVYHVTGDKVKKLSALKAAIAAKPDYAAAHHLLAQSQRWESKNSYIELMEKLYATPEIAPADKIQLGFALGKTHADLKDYTSAFGYFKEANKLKRQSFTFDSYQLARDMEAVAAHTGKEWLARFAQAGLADETPVFIVGLPRSGSSLVEQILSSHSQVHGAGELNLVPQEVLGLERKKRVKFPALLGALHEEEISQFGKWYSETLRALHPKATRIIDKLPGNFLYLGLLKAALPNAKFIHCTRDAMDNGLSLFAHFFGDTLLYAYDLYEIGCFIRSYQLVMAHWQTMLPEGSIYTLSYEKLIQQPEQEILALVEHCGLPWEETCLQFYAQTRPVHTASADQVRRKLYKDAIGNATRYGDLLAPLKAALEY